MREDNDHRILIEVIDPRVVLIFFLGGTTTMVQHRVDTTNSSSSNNNNIYVSDNIPVRRLPGTHWYSSSRHNGGGAELRQQQQQQQQLPERQQQQYPTTSATPSSHHRILRLPGCQLRPHADWMAEHFTTTAATTTTTSHSGSSTSTGTEGDNPSSSLSSHSLYCHSAWWLHLEGTLASTVPAGRWDVSVLLQYHTAKAARPRKNIAWSVYVMGSDDVFHKNDKNDDAIMPALLIRTGRTGGSWGPPQTWTRYTMGTITITQNNNNNSTVRWVIQGMDGTTPLTDVSFGGFELRSCSVDDWRKEAILLRMLDPQHPSGSRREEPASKPRYRPRCAPTQSDPGVGRTVDLSSRGRRCFHSPRPSAEVTASTLEDEPQQQPRCSSSQQHPHNSNSLTDRLPREIVVRIAQFLITPLPHETLLLQRY